MPTRDHPRWFHLLPAAIALAIGVSTLEHWPLWQGEVFAWDIARRPAGEILERVARDRHPPLFFALASAALHVFDRDGVLRLPSVAAWCLGVLVTTRVGLRHLGSAQGLVAGFGLAVSPFAVVWGCTARPYGLVLLTSALLLGSSLDLAQGPRPRRAAVGIAAFGALGLWTHFASSAALASAALASLAGGGRSGWRRGALGVGAALAAAVSLAPWAMGPMRGQVAESPVAERSVHAWLYLLWDVRGYVPAAGWVALGLAALGCLRLARLRHRSAPALLAWAACGLALPWLASTVPDVIEKRYTGIWFLPAFQLLAAHGLAALTPWVRPGALAAGWAAAWAFPVAAVLGAEAVPAMAGGSNSGRWDPRRDIAFFREVVPDFDVAALRELPSATFSPYRPYEVRILGPGRDVSRPRSGWFGWRHEDPEGTGVPDDAPPSLSCVFRDAFTVVVDVRDELDCRQLVDGLIAAADQGSRYGPFVLEAARLAFDGGDPSRARALARRAQDATPLSAAPSVLLAQIELASGDADAAIAATAVGQEVGRRWYDRREARALWEARRAALLALDRRDESRDALERVRCLDARPPPTCPQRLDDLLAPHRVVERKQLSRG